MMIKEFQQLPWQFKSKAWEYIGIQMVLWKSEIEFIKPETNKMKMAAHPHQKNYHMLQL